MDEKERKIETDLDRQHQGRFDREGVVGQGGETQRMKKK